mmetsp:Transcript_133140/g.413984  ORF Transcript_133140/g.413984 Transcript_133140/m.413984 type:complete len:226 (-) Transcript_133140:88-765(-)
MQCHGRRALQGPWLPLERGVADFLESEATVWQFFGFYTLAYKNGKGEEAVDSRDLPAGAGWTHVQHVGGSQASIIDENIDASWTIVQNDDEAKAQVMRTTGRKTTIFLADVFAGTDYNVVQVQRIHDEMPAAEAQYRDFMEEPGKLGKRAKKVPQLQAISCSSTGASEGSSAASSKGPALALQDEDPASAPKLAMEVQVQARPLQPVSPGPPQGAPCKAAAAPPM